jgi:hypothetical protein
MNPKRRSAYALILVLLVVAGLILVVEASLDPIVYNYQTATQVCDFPYTVQLNPYQTTQEDCAVLKGDWMELQMSSSYNLTVTVWLNLVNGAGRSVLFNDSGTNLNASLPISSDGALIDQLYNSNSSAVSVNGSIAIYSSTIANTTILTTKHPYRTIGAGLLAVGALGLFFVIWNPKVSFNQTLITRKKPPQN